MAYFQQIVELVPGGLLFRGNPEVVSVYGVNSSIERIAAQLRVNPVSYSLAPAVMVNLSQAEATVG